MKLTIEELRKVYETGYTEGDALNIKATTPHQAAQTFHDEALLAVARFVAERQRAVAPTEEMLAAYANADESQYARDWEANARSVYRAMQSVAPLVVPE